MAGEIVGRRQFTASDQQWFATLSGDINPIHVDPVTARRTQAGGCVVHGIHGVLWALDGIRDRLGPRRVRGIEARFERFIPVAQEVTLQVVADAPDAMRVEVRIDAATVTLIMLRLGERRPATDEYDSGGGRQDAIAPSRPLEWDLRDLVGYSGFIPDAQVTTAYSDAFPRASSLLGASGVADLATFSRMVGMVCPGLHSIFLKFSLNSVAQPLEGVGTVFKVRRADERVRRVTVDVAGSSLRGVVECAVRRAPVRQAGMTDLTSLVGPDDFEGATALVIGGSRGLGEVVAKLVAAGGGHPIITYAVGQADAAAVAAEISDAGGRCDVLRFDSKLDVADQLSALQSQPTHVYYFASSSIFRQKSALFSEKLLAEFLELYTGPFYRICEYLTRSRQPLVAFYPSSVAVADRPRGLTEYAAAKAAGEVLCADMNAFMASVTVVVERLPRLATDQTATLTHVETASVLDTMLAIMRRVHAGEAITFV